MAKYKHLTLEDRRLIEDSLNTGFPFKKIGRLVGKDCTTISKEVRNNHTTQQTGCYGHRYNNCSYALTCAKSHLCHDCENPRSAKRCW